MKNFIIRISLLLFSGLILPFGQNKAVNHAVVTCKYAKAACPVSAKIEESGFSFFNNVAVNILPVLKNLK